MSYAVSPQVNLSLQIATLLILLAGLALKRKQKFLLHGFSMLVAVVLNALSFFVVMGPSFYSMKDFVSSHPFDELAIATLGHAALGTLAEILALGLIVLWHFQSSTQGCMRRKKLMKATFLLWVMALVIGIFLYTLLYTTIFG